MEDEGQPSQILPFLYLGSRVDAKNKEVLQKLGIRHILNATPTRNDDPVAGTPNFFEKDKNFVYKRCALFDNSAEDILRSLDGCISFIEQGKHYGGVLVHCNKGVSRSPSIVIAYLMKTRKLSFEEALAEVKARRATVQPNASFMRQLQEYERRLKRQETRSTAVKGPTRPVKGPARPTAIGPALPPGFGKPQAEETLGDGSTGAADLKPKIQIGPATGPDSKLSQERKVGAAMGSRHPASKEQAITTGPALPPTSLESKARAGEKQTSDTPTDCLKRKDVADGQSSPKRAKTLSAQS